MLLPYLKFLNSPTFPVLLAHFSHLQEVFPYTSCEVPTIPGPSTYSYNIFNILITFTSGMISTKSRFLAVRPLPYSCTAMAECLPTQWERSEDISKWINEWKRRWGHQERSCHEEKRVPGLTLGTSAMWVDVGAEGAGEWPEEGWAGRRQEAPERERGCRMEDGGQRAGEITSAVTVQRECKDSGEQTMRSLEREAFYMLQERSQWRRCENMCKNRQRDRFKARGI